MLITKAKLKEQINSLPEEFSIDELIERLIVIEKIESGSKQSQNKQVLSEEEMDEESTKWFE